MSNSAIRRRALVVDDDDTNRQILQEYLEDEGYDVKVFSQPEAVDCDVAGCSLVLVDVRFQKHHEDGRMETHLFGGIDFVLAKIESGVLDAESATIIFMSRWRRDREGVPERLAKVGRHQWVDINTGLEITDLVKALRGN